MSIVERGDRDTRSLLEKAYERLLPAIGYMHSSTAGFAATTIVFLTWIIIRSRAPRAAAEISLEKDRERLVEIQYRIQELDRKKELLQRALSKAEGAERERITRQLKRLESELEDLYEELDLIEARIAAIEKLRRLHAEGVIPRLNKIIRELNKGHVDEPLYSILRALEDRWRKRQLTKEALRRILEEG